MVFKANFYPVRSDQKRRVLEDIQINGWFYINPLVATNSTKFNEYKTKYPEIFRIEHSLTRHVYVSYLNEDEFNEFYASQDFDLAIYGKPSDRDFVYSELNQYRVRAVDNWITNQSCTKVRFESFSCYLPTRENVSVVRYDPMVNYVEAFHGYSYQSRFSAGYVDSGSSCLAFDGNILKAKRSLYDHGLTGKDQIITVLDNGCDTTHSFFRDSIPVNTEDIMENHRKIIKYDVSDVPSDNHTHGTYVAGLAAGKPQNFDESYNALYSGVAMDAKLHLIENGNMLDPYFISAYEAMEHVDSQIMTSNIVMNKVQPQFTDDINILAYKNPESLFVFPSGNKHFQIYAPGDAVNGITVGSSINPLMNVTFSNGEHTIILREFSSTLYTAAKLIDSRNIKISQVDESDSIFITDKCFDGELNALAVVFPNTTDYKNCANLANKVVFVCNIEDFQAIINMKIVNISFITAEYTEITPSEFNSPGPSQWGLKKPDIMAPGENILSANASSEGTGIESLIAMTGTSASAAQITGFVALIKQYFNEGYYPTLKPNINDKQNVSSALVKAVLVNCAKNLTDRPVRNARGGYGVPIIKDGLGFGEQGVRFMDKQKIYPHQHLIYEITTERKSDFSITLNYIDYPTLTQEFGALTADLNLVVEYQNETILGNMNPRGGEEELSPCEKIIIKDMEPQTLTVHIYSNDFNPDAKIEYALAIMGGFSTDNENAIPFNLKPLPYNNKCPGNCSGNTCGEEGWCECPINYRGTYCQTKMRELDITPNNGRNVYHASDREIEWYYLNVPQYHYNKLYFSTRWHTNWVNQWVTVIGDSKYGAADCHFRYFIPSDPQHERLTFITDFTNMGYNKTLYFGVYLTYEGEQEGRIGGELLYVPTPAPTPLPTMTPLPSPTPLPTPTIAATPSGTPSMTPSSSPNLTPSDTPSTTPSITPSSTPSSTPSITPSSTPSSTPSTTPSITPSSTPSTTPSSTPSITPSITPSTTPDTTPSITPSTTPSTTPDTTPSITPSTTPDTTPSITPSTTPSTTPDTTPSSTPSTTPNTTPSTTPSSTPSATLPDPTRSPARTLFAASDSSSSSNAGQLDNNKGNKSKTTVSWIIAAVSIVCLLIIALIAILLVTRHLKNKGQSESVEENNEETETYIYDDAETMETIMNFKEMSDIEEEESGSTFMWY